MDPKSKKALRFKRTIAKELHEKWRELYRKNDCEKIIEVLKTKGLKFSKPTIDKAIIYGCVHQQVLVDAITKYFADRLLAEKDIAAGLHELQTKAQVA